MRPSDYTTQGVASFKRTALHNASYIENLKMYGAFYNHVLIGVIATRNEGNHIALFFVDGSYHRQGIGSNLFQEVRKNCTANEVTVNSSPYAVEVYHKLGFLDNGPEQLIDGIRFTPMTCNI